MSNGTPRHPPDDQPLLSFASPGAILSQLALIRADLLQHPFSVCHIETRNYSSSKVEDLDRLMRDIRARRVEEFNITEGRWGARRIIINYFGR